MPVPCFGTVNEDDNDADDHHDNDDDNDDNDDDQEDYDDNDDDYFYKYKEIQFINLSLGALGTVGSSSESFINLLKCLEVSQPIQRSILSKMINITIRCTYFIFCRRNKPWTDPDLLAFKVALFFFFYIISFCVETCYKILYLTNFAYVV